jgi:hypothetical protein
MAIASAEGCLPLFSFTDPDPIVRILYINFAKELRAGESIEDLRDERKGIPVFD